MGDRLLVRSYNVGCGDCFYVRIPDGDVIVPDPLDPVAVGERKIAVDDAKAVQKGERRRDAEAQREDRHSRHKGLLGQHAEAHLGVESDAVSGESAQSLDPNAPHRSEDVAGVSPDGSAVPDSPFDVARE